MHSRRTVLKTLLASLGLQRAIPSPGSTGGVPCYVDIAASAGLRSKTVIGGEHIKNFILETTGGGVALLDYDKDGWLDIFLVNGSRLDGFPLGQEPSNHLYRNNRDGTFTDVTREARLLRHGWGQGSAQAITITTAISTCLLLITARMFCIITTEMAPLPM